MTTANGHPAELPSDQPSNDATSAHVIKQCMMLQRRCAPVVVDDRADGHAEHHTARERHVGRATPPSGKRMHFDPLEVAKRQGNRDPIGEDIRALSWLTLTRFGSPTPPRGDRFV